MSDELPPGWSRHKLTDVVLLPTGQVNPQSLPYRAQPLLAPDHVESATGRIMTLESAEAQGASSGKYIVRPGDVILSKIRPALRKVALARFNGTCSADMYPMRSLRLAPEILQSELLGERFSLFAESVSGRTGIPKLNRSDLSSYELNIPPAAEQSRIIKILESMSESEYTAEGEVLKAEAVRRGLVESLISRKATVFSQFLTDGPSNGIYKPAECYGENGIPIVRIGSFDGGPSDLTSGLLRVRVSDAEIERFSIRVGDVLINRVNTPGLVGKSTVVSRLDELTLYESNIMRCRVDSSKISPLLVQEWLSSSLVRAYFASRTKPAVSQASINRRDILSCPMPIMSSAEQGAFLDRLDAVDNCIRVGRARVAKLKSLKYALSADLLSGRTAKFVARVYAS
ncbi:restriction endonuclease subunit S [Streptomyces sp. NPDC023723]|uniref:restriction endonuclease subunit S n=1 Tax=Streptomyces sp. NPDC023723 TaxID=3154323 RepID=UPI0034107C2A